jgi:hypothetical protein
MVALIWRLGVAAGGADCPVGVGIVAQHPAGSGAWSATAFAVPREGSAAGARREMNLGRQAHWSVRVLPHAIECRIWCHSAHFPVSTSVVARISGSMLAGGGRRQRVDAIAKNTFSTLDSFAWWRVIRMLKRRHHLEMDQPPPAVHQPHRAVAADHGGHDRVVADRGVAGHLVPLPRHHDPQPLGPHIRMFTEAVNARAHRVTRRPPVEMLAEQARRVAPVARGAIHRGVRGDPHDRREHPLIWFDHAQYSVPHRLAGQTVRSAATVCRS